MKLNWKRIGTVFYVWHGTTQNWGWYYSIERDMTYSVYTVQLHLPNGDTQEVGSQYTLPEAKKMAKAHAEQRHARV